MSDTQQWSDVCQAGEVDEGDAKAFHVNGKRLCVVNDGKGYYALDDVCTHGMAFLSDGFCDPEEGVIECPLHGGLFSYCDGSVKGAPAERPTRVYPILVENDVVKVRL
ncbi:MAG TPA: non-heme iron oxygenase ferredoxin subunit [Bordetella sp.]